MDLTGCSATGEGDWWVKSEGGGPRRIWSGAGSFCRHHDEICRTRHAGDSWICLMQFVVDDVNDSTSPCKLCEDLFTGCRLKSQ